MRQTVYSLHFRGTARPAGGSGKLIRATAAAVSCSFTTLVTSAGVDSTFEAKATDEDAILESEITLVSDHGFSEGGNVSFGEVSVVRFRSLGEAQLTPGESGLMYGGAVLKV